MKICPVCSREYPGDASLCDADGVALVELSSASRDKPEDLVGTIVEGRYRIEDMIGRGGMGHVYRCRHVVVGKAAAMKVLRAGAERSEGVLARFIREAQTANSIKSRHIAEIFDFGQLPNGSFYVVMELLEGEDLTRALKKQRLTALDLVHVFHQVAETLELAHAMGIVHRDLKPDNVFLVHDGDDPNFVKLLDFGIAKVMHGEATAFTETGVILGTPYYMSPEQARGERVDHRSDVYALGVMMYRAFTGKLPFVADSTMGVLTRHLTELPEPPSHVSQVDLRLERVILRCLEKRPEARFQSMREVADALASLTGAPARIREEPTRVDAPPAPPSFPNDPSLDHRAPVLSPSGRFPIASPSSHAAMASAFEASSPPTRTSTFAGQRADPQASNAPPSHAVSVPPQNVETSRVFSTTSRVAAPKRSPALLVVGAVAMLAAGAGAAYGLFGAARSPSNGPRAEEASAQTSVAAAPVPVSAPVAASASASSSAPSLATSAPASSIDRPSSEKPSIPSPPHLHPPAHATAAATAAPTAPHRSGEIRSPFE